MASLRLKVFLACAFAAALAVAGIGQTSADSRGSRAAGAAAAGLAIGLIIGGAASQNQAQDRGGARAYRNCASMFGPGAVNSSSNPGKCVCRTGYTWANDGGKRCVARSNGVAATRSLRTEPTHSTADLEKIQESLNLLGYDAGNVDGSLGRKTQQAVLKFQADKQLPQTGHLSPAEQQILFKDVEAKREAEARRLQKIPEIAQKAEQERSLPKPDARMELAHWETVRNSKLPAELEDYIARYPNGEFTKLASLRLEQVKIDIVKAEDEKKAKQPPAQANKPPPGTAQLPPLDETHYPKARLRRTDAVAVIIGNSAYRNGVPAVDYGTRDAEAMKLIAMRTLGLDAGNVLLLKDATRGAIDEVFGTDKDHKGKLWRHIDPDGRSDVYVFYSGHGMPGVNAEDAFLLPVDGDPNHASLNGYPLSLLYKNLGELKTKSTTVFLDACFSGQSPDANNTTLIKQASPVFVTKTTPGETSKINLFAAAGERQLSNWDAEAGHGIFTRWVLAGLSGEADEDKNREVTAKELHEYVSRQVRRSARRTHGREQDPFFKGNAGFVLSSF